MNSLKSKAVFVLVFAMLVFVISIIANTTTPTAYAAFPGANGKIAFQHCGPFYSYPFSCRPEIWVMEPDGSNQTMLTYGFHPSWSPDGTKIAFMYDGWIWVMNADGSNQVQLSDGQDHDPAWCSNDKIVFESIRDGNNEIYIMDNDGGNQTRLTFDPDWDGDPACSPDGTQIAFSSDRAVSEGGPEEIYKMNIDGSNLVRLTNVSGNKGEPNWSPDSKKIALRHSWTIWKMDADGEYPNKNLEQLTFDCCDYAPAWSPDGNKIVFHTTRHYPDAHEIYMMNPDGNNQERITYNSTYMDEFPDWQPLNRSPICDGASSSQEMLWPPNHEFVPIEVLGVTDPDGDELSIAIDGIFQDEEVNARGSGKTSPDGMGIGDSIAQVRAERAGTNKTPGNGRVYHIFFTADDGYGGSCSGKVLIGVPHDKKDTPVDDGPLYDSTVVDP